MNFAARKIVNRDLTRLQRRRMAASGWVTPVLVALLSAGLLLASYNHKRGNFHRLRTAVLSSPPQTARPMIGPGGQAAVSLGRSATSLGAYPEFVGMTLLPGRGFNVLQITAVVPGRGEVQLMHSPSLDEAERTLTDSGADANGRLSTTFGGAFLAPWSARIPGAPTQNAPGHLDVLWQGHRFSVPAAAAEEGVSDNVSTEGLFLDRTADSVRTGVIGDGQWAEALYRLNSFGNAWTGALEINARAELSGHTIDLTLNARNTSDTPMPVGMGWHPYFNLPSANRSAATLHIPSSTLAIVDRRTGLPTGRTERVRQAVPDFARPDGAGLGSGDLLAVFTDLQRAVMADGPMVELRDADADYGLRITLLSEAINNVQVHAPRGEPWVSMEFDTNEGDPFGRQWGESGSGIRVLPPGGTLTFRLRLEIFSPSSLRSDIFHH